MIRAGLRDMLADTEIQVVAEVATGQAAVNYALTHPVDVALLDIRMPDGDGRTALARIKLDKPDLPVLMITAFDDPTHLARAVALGASGFLMKTCSRDELTHAIKAASTGERTWTREELRRMTGTVVASRLGTDLEVSLTPRENDVLRHMAKGLANKEIAEALRISTETVKEHVQNIFHKIGATCRTQAAVWAIRNNLE
jgi:DNA-binding NarL/FixJ family response regulator